jgi:hypothetical protein
MQMARISNLVFLILVGCLLSGCANPHLDGTTQASFDHSLAVVAHNVDHAQAAELYTKVASASIELGSDNVRRSMDDMTYDEAIAYLNTHSRK